MKSKSKNIAIITSPYKSENNEVGILLGKSLSVSGFNVKYISRPDYMSTGSDFQRVYSGRMDGFHELNLETSQHIAMVDYVLDNKIESVISIDTFIERSLWISKVKKLTNALVCDVPASGNIIKENVSSGYYKRFDEIWCTSSLTSSLFDGHSNLKDVRIKLRELVTYGKSEDSINLFLDASGKDRRNVESTIRALRRIIGKYKNVKIITSGIQVKGEKGFFDYTNSMVKQFDCVIDTKPTVQFDIKADATVSSGLRLVTGDTANVTSEDLIYRCKASQTLKFGKIIPYNILSENEIFKQVDLAVFDILNEVKRHVG